MSRDNRRSLKCGRSGRTDVRYERTYEYRRYVREGFDITRRVECWQEVFAPAPDVCRAQRGRRQYGSHYGRVEHADAMSMRRPRLSAEFEAIEQMAEYLEDRAAMSSEERQAIQQQPPKLRRAFATHNMVKVVDTDGQCTIFHRQVYRLAA